MIDPAQKLRATERNSCSLRVKALSVVYPGGVTALDQLDLAFAGGTVTALLGANGAGKTTLLKILAGSVRPSSGTVEAPPHAGFGYAAQAPALDPEMSGAEILALFAALHRVPRRHRAAKIDALAARFGLTEHQPRRVAGYSGGLRRRLHLALVWLCEPDVLLLDEPTADLDPQGRSLIWELIAERAAAGSTVVVATHDLPQAQRHCSRVVILERGRTLADGPPAEIARRHAGPRMVLSLTAVPADPESVESALAGLSGVRAARCRGDELAIDTEPGARVQDRVLAVLAEAGHEMTAIGFLRDDLESAYFRLAGPSSTGSRSEH